MRFSTHALAASAGCALAATVAHAEIGSPARPGSAYIAVEGGYTRTSAPKGKMPASWSTQSIDTISRGVGVGASGFEDDESYKFF